MRLEKKITEKEELLDDDHSLSQLLEKKFSIFLKRVRHTNPRNLYELLMSECERPLFNLVLQETEGNQVKAAKMLGINRNTLRKKIETFQIKIQKGKKKSLAAKKPSSLAEG